MRKNILLTLFLGASIPLLTISCNKDDSVMEKDEPMYEEIVAVANRGNSSVSFIDARKNSVISTLTIPASELMYLVYVPKNDKLYVGDRAAKKVHVINPQTKMVESSINVGAGVFHMWADGLSKQLWVNNDRDKTISVIDLSTNAVIKTIAVDTSPHDVFLTKDGSTAYVSVIAGLDKPNKIYMYRTSDFTKTGEVEVGIEPHLYHLSNSNKLYAPCQISGDLYVLNGATLAIESKKVYVGAHGIAASTDQQRIYVTNISGKQLFSMNKDAEPLTTVDIKENTPHNLVLNEAGTMLYTTHSGAAANKVSFYEVNNSGAITNEKIITTAGVNPFGITYYKRQVVK